jgi:hypothetical protein
MIYDKALFETPAGRRFFAAIELEIEREVALRLAREYILKLLGERFFIVPGDVAWKVRKIEDQDRLDDLLIFAGTCRTLWAFVDEVYESTREATS